MTTTAGDLSGYRSTGRVRVRVRVRVSVAREFLGSVNTTSCACPYSLKRCGQQERTGQSEPGVHRVHWNQELLAYTLYTADEVGRVTTWDLKPVLLGLVRL